MKKSVFLPVKQMMVFTVILAGLFSFRPVQAQIAIASVSVGTQSSSITYGTAGTVTFPLAFTVTGSGSGSTTLSINWTAPTGVTTTFPMFISFTEVPTSIVLSINTTAATPAGTTSFTVTSSSGGVTSAPANFVVSGKPLTISGLTGVNKIYDGTTAATLSGPASLVGILGADVVTLDGTPVLNFADASVGINKLITVTGYTIAGAGAGNYVLTQPTGLIANITPKPLTINGLTGADKPYDGTTLATTNGTAVLAGVIGTDVVTLGGTPVLNFASASVGNGIVITVSGYTIGGANAANYTVTQPTGLTANITVKPLTISGLAGVTRVYDGSTTATSSGSAVLTGIISPDAVTLGGVPVLNFANALAGNDKTITVTGYTISGANAGNYSLVQPVLTANITPKPLTISGLSTYTSRSYNGTTGVSVSGVPLINGVISPDVVDLDYSGASYTFTTKEVGTNKTIEWHGLILTGSDAGNYSIAPLSITANISAAILTVTSPSANKIYDGTTVATITGSLSGIYLTDVVIFAGTGTFASANAADGIAVTPTCTLTGADAGNYTLTQPSGLTGNITPRSLTITATGAAKIYGTALTAGMSTTNFSISGIITGEAITGVTLHPNAAGLLPTTPAGGSYSVKPELPITFTGGFLLSNYTVTFTDYQGIVSAKPIVVTPKAGQQKMVGTADPVLSYTYSPALVGSETFTGILSRETGETVGGSYAITIGTLSAGNNYSLTLAPGTFTITSVTSAVMTAFNFTFSPSFSETINQTAGTITVPIANSANAAFLVPVFTVSPGATVRVDGVLQTSGVTLNNFTGVVNYVVTSYDGSTSKSYTVTVTKNTLATEKQLLTFSFDAIPDAIGIVDQSDHTVKVTVPATCDITRLVAIFSVSPMAKVFIGAVSQTSGVTANNFTQALTTGINYTIQAENGATLIYTVTLTRAASRTDRQLLAFSLPGINGAVDEVDHSIRMTIPYAYTITSRAAAFTSSYASTVWLGSTPQTTGFTLNDYTLALTTGMTYTVKAENASLTQDYILYITRTAASTEKQMISFQFNGLVVPSVGAIDQATGTINITIPYSANRAHLNATFTNSTFSTVKIGSTLQVSGVTYNDFTTDKTYTVIAEDLSTKNYTVHVTQSPASTSNQLLTFQASAVYGPVNGVINESAKSVLVEVPYGTDIDDLVTNFTVSPFATVKIGSTSQISGINHNSFAGPVPYSIIAENGAIEIYTIVVRVIPAIIDFSFKDIITQPVGLIDPITHTITVHVPYSVDKTALKAYFTVSGGAIVTIGTLAQVSGVTPNDFTALQTYTLQVTGGSTSNYVVSVISDPVRTGKQVLAFAFSGLTPPFTGIIDQTLKTVTINVPYRTDVTNLVATFSLSELASAKVGAVLQSSGVTPNSFISPVVYTLTAEDGGIQNYTVTVNIMPGSTAKDITYFAFEDLNPDVVGEINQTNLTITATVLNGQDRSALRAFFSASPLSTVRIVGISGVIQESGSTVNDFRIPLVYEVTAEDGSTKRYTVTISEGPDITSPVVTNSVQNVTNRPGQFVMIRSNESTGKAYIILESVTQTTVADLNAAVAAGYGRFSYVSAANTDIPVSTANLTAGNYYAYAIDNAGNKSIRGTNVMTVIDRIPPVVNVAAQTISNSLTSKVNIKSSEANSIVYLILEGVAQTSKPQLDNAVFSKRGAKALVNAANVDVPVNVSGLLPGNYHAYAVDYAENLSDRSTNVVVITMASSAKSMLAFSFNGMTPPAIGQIVGMDISVKVRVGTPVTAIRSTFTISELAKAYVGSVEQVNNVTENDFTNPVVYRVIAEDGTYFDYTVTVSFNTGIEETVWFNSIKAYPNPVTDRLSIEMTRPADRIQIINGLGQTMEDIHNPGQTTVEIQTGSWKNGIYMVRYYLDGQYVGVKKLIKD